MWEKIKNFFVGKKAPIWREVWIEKASWMESDGNEIALKYSIEFNPDSGEHRLLHTGKNSDKHAVYNLAKIQLRVLSIKI